MVESGPEIGWGSTAASLGGALGLVSAGGALVLSVGLPLVSPYGRNGATAGTTAVFFGLAALALVALWASATRRPGWLVVIFVLSFLPVGLYLLGTPGLFRWIGICQAGYPVAAILLWFGGSAVRR